MGDGLDEAFDAPFGGVVERVSRESDVPAVGRDLDDAAAALGSQTLSNEIQHLIVVTHRLRDVFMLHRVAKIYMYFQGSPFAVGDSTQHECNKKSTCHGAGVPRSLPWLPVRAGT